MTDIGADIFGEVLLDQLEVMEKTGSGRPVHYFIERDDNLLEVRDASMYFDPPEMWPEEEISLLDKLEPPFLDIGCGAGRHSLYLMDKAIDVKSLDISPGAIEVCRRRGLPNTVVGSITQLGKMGERFKSFILFGANLGLGGTIKGTIEMLLTLSKISLPEAQIVGNYVEPTPTTDPVHKSYHQKNRERGKPIGEMRFRIRYKNQISDWIDFIALQASEFENIVSQTPWEIREELINGRQRYVRLGLEI